MKFRMSLLVTAIVTGVAAAPMAADADITQAQFDKWKTELSNWGRWGKDDEKGTLNLITPEKRKQAAALVREGVTVSLARELDTVKAIDNNSPFEHTMNPIRPAASSDRFAINYHGSAHTHLDALGHHFIDGKMYNGFGRDEFVTVERGAEKGAVTTAAEGIVTRGVLVDIPRLKGVDYLEPGTRITVADIEAWEKMAGVKIGPGDAVFFRTGRWARRAKVGPWNLNQEAAGLDTAVLPWIRARDIALIGSEYAVDASPIPKTITNPDDYLPVHNFVLVILGMQLIDNTDLDALAAVAAERKRWEFMLTIAPLRVKNGTGSPVNPIAVF
jgi:kynurenine formamidase